MKAVREEEVGFVKQVGFMPGVKVRRSYG